MNGPPTPRRSVYADKLSEFPDLAFGDDLAFRRRGRWRDFFRGRAGPAFAGRVVFEIGCADAEFLSRVAAAHPSVGFVGLDWKCKSLYDGARRVAERALRNVALLRGRAQDLPRFFADGELDEVWVFHPDPCATPVERPNRLIDEPFLIDVHRALGPPGSILALKTDHPGYYQSTLALLGLPEPPWFQPARSGGTEPSSPRVKAREVDPPEQLPAASAAARDRFDVSANAADYWNDPAALARTAARCFAGETTGFESRFIQKRLPIYYVELTKRACVTGA